MPSKTNHNKVKQKFVKKAKKSGKKIEPGDLQKPVKQKMREEKSRR